MKNKYGKVFSILILIIFSLLLSGCNFCQAIAEIKKCFAKKKTSDTLAVNINHKDKSKNKFQYKNNKLINNDSNKFYNQVTNKKQNPDKDKDKDKSEDLVQHQNFEFIKELKSKEEQSLTLAMLECLANKEDDVYAMYRLGEIYLNGLLDVEQNSLIAYDWFYKAAIRGFSKGMWQLGNMYLDGIGTESLTLKAIEWYQDAAKLGNIQAMLALGYLYKSGYLDIPIDYHKSIYWYSKAASIGSYEAEYHMAKLIEQGLIDKRKYPINMHMAINSLKQAVEKGDPEAMLILAEHYLNIKEYSLALIYYQKAVDQNYTKALLRLGVLYLHGEIIPKNYEKAIYLLDIAANASDTNAEYYLGEMYQQGLGLSVNMKLAAFWYTKAANKNFMKALVKLGDLYFFGKGVEPNLYKALELYTKAANMGDSYSRLLLSIFYSKGIIVTQDLTTSVHWFNLGSEQEDQLLAKFNIGRLYEIGIGFKKNLKEAVKWYLLSAKNGYAKAQAKIADLYTQGINGKPDYKQAIEWYQKAAKQGYSYAEYSLGLLLQNKLLKAKDTEIKMYNPHLASVFMKRAAINSYRPAQYSLGIMYLEGIGVQINPIKAYAWLIVALNDTYESNSELMDVLINQLDTKAREQAVILEKRYRDRYTSQSQKQ